MNFPATGFLIPAGSKNWPGEERYPLGHGKTTIGRAPSCDVQINIPTVSRLHAELNWADGRLMLTHLSAVNHTLVNGIPVREVVALRGGDLIEIADGILLRLELYTSGEEVTLAIGRDNRRMYAILHADVVGYSRLTEDNDIATARQIEACLSVIRRETERRSGRVVNIAGDGILLAYISQRRSRLDLRDHLSAGLRGAEPDAPADAAHGVSHRHQFGRHPDHPDRCDDRRRDQHRRPGAGAGVTGWHSGHRRRARPASGT